MRPSKSGRSGGQANALADLKRLRKEAEAAASWPANPDTTMEAALASTTGKGHKPRESLAAAKRDEAGLALERAPARPAYSSSPFAGLDRMVSSTKKGTQSGASARAKASAAGVDAGSAPPSSTVNEQDKALFRLAVKSVQPIKDTRRAILPPVADAPAAMLRERRQHAAGVDLDRLPQAPDQYGASEARGEGSFVRQGHGPDLIKGLKRGKWPIAASLDLHGNTQEEARDRLDRFLQSCLSHHIKCVRIVHGKGYGSKDGESVLKQTVRRWLAQLADVLAYTECSAQDGGSGAVQVLLQVVRPPDEP